MSNSKEVWVLTTEYAGYDQHGEYFEAVWPSKPSIAQLAVYFQMSEQTGGLNVMRAVEFLETLRNTGSAKMTDGDDITYSLELKGFA